MFNEKKWYFLTFECYLLLKWYYLMMFCDRNIVKNIVKNIFRLFDI